MDTLDDVKAALGEHYEHYLIVVSKEPHGCEIEYNNSFAAKGLIDIASKIIDNNLDTNYPREALKIEWTFEDEDEDEENEDDE